MIRPRPRVFSPRAVNSMIDIGLPSVCVCVGMIL